MAKESTYSSVTPLLTDLVRVVDDPGGTPATANATLQAVMDLFEANFAAPADFIDAITEIAAALKTGADGTLVTGTAGTSGNLAMWNADGDAVDSTVVAANVVVNGDIGSTVQAYDADTLKADTADVLTAGFAVTDYNAGTQSTGTFTPDEANGNQQYIVNGGAFTLAPQTNSSSIVLHITNNASAGTITTSGFTKVAGDSFTTTDTHEFVCTLVKINSKSVLNVVALQ